MRNFCTTPFFPLFFLLLFGFLSSLSAQNLQTGFGLGSASFESGQSLALDGTGNLYVVGTHAAAFDVDPSAAVVTLSHAGSSDIFLAKYNAAGALVWAFSLGSANAESPSAVALDAVGDVYIAGRYQGTLDFDPDVPVASQTSAGNTDIFVAKYSSAGVYQWAISMGGTSADEALSLCVSGTSRVFVVGSFNAIVDFDPGAGVVSLTSAGSQDLFIGQYNAADGSYRQAQQLGSTTFDAAMSVVVDASDNIYIGGIFGGTVDFDPGPGVVNYTAINAVDGFVASYDAGGGFRWAFRFGGNGFLGEEVRSLALGTSGELYVAGRFQGINIDFDPSANTAALTSQGFQDVFIAQYSQATGAYLWAHNLAGTMFTSNTAYGVSTHSGGEVYLCGSFNSTVDFDPGIGSANLTSAGNTDIFLAKYDKNGMYQWAISVGSTAADEGRSVVAGGTSVYMTGSFNGAADFDPTGGGTTLTSNGSTDIFFTQYSSSPLPVEWEYFGVAANPQGVMLEWKTASELNNEFFAVQRSFDGVFFEQIGTVAGKGNSTTGHSYTFLDEHPWPGVTFYRLKQVDTDGAFDYSNIVELRNDNPQVLLTAFPNPARDRFEFRLLGATGTTPLDIALLDATGRIVCNRRATSTRGELDVSALSPGIYLLKAQYQRETFQQRIMIQP